MSRRKMFKILPRYTARGRIVRMAQNAVKNKVKHSAGLIYENDKHVKKKSKGSII